MHTTTTAVDTDHVTLEASAIGTLFAAISRLTDDPVIRGLAQQGEFLATSLADDVSDAPAPIQ